MARLFISYPLKAETSESTSPTNMQSMSDTLLTMLHKEQLKTGFREKKMTDKQTKINSILISC